MTEPHRPTRDEIQSAADRRVPDVIAGGLRVLFCGINPGLYSAAIGHHFGRPGNRFWPVLHAAGITPRLFSPYEDGALLALGYGITNLVERATATADALAPAELAAGGALLVEKVRRNQPRYLAVLGVTAFRAAFGQPLAQVGAQEARLGATDGYPGARLWVLPNPSGLNAHYRLPELAALFAQLHVAASGTD